MTFTARTDRRLVRSTHHSNRFVLAEITAPRPPSRPQDSTLGSRRASATMRASTSLRTRTTSATDASLY